MCLYILLTNWKNTHYFEIHKVRHVCTHSNVTNPFTKNTHRTTNKTNDILIQNIVTNRFLISYVHVYNIIGIKYMEIANL